MIRKVLGETLALGGQLDWAISVMASDLILTIYELPTVLPHQNCTPKTL